MRLFVQKNKTTCWTNFAIQSLSPGHPNAWRFSVRSHIVDAVLAPVFVLYPNSLYYQEKLVEFRWEWTAAK